MKAARLPTRVRESLRCVYSSRPIALDACSRRRALDTSTKQFSTSTCLRAGIAAPEVKFPNQKGNEGEDGEEKIFYARLIPESPSYFTAQPQHIDNLLQIQTLARKHAGLPMVKPGEAPRLAWQSLADYKNTVGEFVRASKYQKMIDILKRLNQIHPALMPAEVKAAINEYARDVDPFRNTPNVIQVDSDGLTKASGRRKKSHASAHIVEGTGEVLINGKTIAEVFGRIHDRETAIWPLKATDRIDKYNVWARCYGGGTTGQAEALTLAVAKALIAHEPALKPALRRAGCVTRDPRRVERKKPGHVKARKMPAWVKR